MFSGILEIFDKAWGRTPLSDSLDVWQNNPPADLDIVGYWTIMFFFLLLLSVWLFSNRKSSSLFEYVFNNLLVVSSAIWLMGVGVYLVGYYCSGLNGLAVIPRAVISSFKMFVVTHDLARVSRLLHGDAIYMSVFSAVHFLAAFITFLFVFKMLGYKINSSLRIIAHRWFHPADEVVHLFWGVNEGSCLLAEDIRRNQETDTIIFIDVDEESEDNIQKKATLSHIANTITIKNSEIVRLARIGALVNHCYNGPAALKGEGETDIFGVLHLKTIFAIVQRSHKSYFYFLSDNEAQNIAGALNLQQDKMLAAMCGNKPVIYVHARRDASNEIFNHHSQYDGGQRQMRVRIVDSAYLSIATLKQDVRLLPVNCVEVDQTTGLVDSPFTALIIGFGGTGQEAFKFLYEYAAFVGHDMKKSPFKCYAVDEKMNKMAGLIREKMPAIGEEELSLIQTVVDSVEFWNIIKAVIGNLNYVVIAFNNDTEGLSLAVNLFKYALRNRTANHSRLKIVVRCYDNKNERRMAEVIDNLDKSVEDHNVEMRLYGREEDLYCCNTILSDDVMTEAKEFNKVYENSVLSAEEQWQHNFGEGELVRLMTQKKMSRYHAVYDINRRIAQNISNSQHSRTKMILMGLYGNEASQRLKQFYGFVNSRESGTTEYKCNEADAQLLNNMAMVEHERWIASHKLIGYTYSPENNCVKKHHKCICPWLELDETTRAYDCNIVDTTIRMAYKRIFE